MTDRPIRLLVADDHPVVRRGMSALLASLDGVEVVAEASTGAEALRVARDAGHVHLLVTDLSMPGMSGCELAERLTRDHDELRVLFLSGYGTHELERVAGARPESTFLEKPFSPSSLVCKLRELLRRAP